MNKIKTINIHGREYTPVSERVRIAHADKKLEGCHTEILRDEPVVIRAWVKVGEFWYTGISAANPAKLIEKTNPYEVAETSAIGRALGFAGYGIEEGIASADEIVKSGVQEKKAVYATQKQIGMIAGLLEQKGQTDEALKVKYNVESKKDLTITQASQIIENLLKLPDTDSDNDARSGDDEIGYEKGEDPDFNEQ